MELAALSDPALIPATIAATLRLRPAGAEPTLATLNAALADKNLLLLLDNCEHLIEAAAQIADALLQRAEGVRLLATSREPLRASDETVYRVPGLATPDRDVTGAAEIMRHGAVELFLARMRAADARSVVEETQLGSIADICRRLDGIPLAIELAASQAAALGIQEVAGQLDNRFQLLASGRRTALPRHQTMRAALDWSYEMLSEPERVMLRKLSIFVGPFSLDAAVAVAGASGSAQTVVDGLSGLVAKSLIAADRGSVIDRYRLLEMTRVYAVEKLRMAGELDEAALRHAEYYRDFFRRIEAKEGSAPATAWTVELARKIDNVRAALTWAFSPGGDASIGVSLTAAAAGLWMQLSLVEEARQHVEQALSAVTGGAECDAPDQMKLYAALAASLMSIRPGTAEIELLAQRALQLAEALGDSEYRLRALYDLWFFNTNHGRHRTALAYAERFCAVAAASPDANDQLVGERSLGTTFHILGDQSTARRHMENVLERHVSANLRTHPRRFGFDLTVIATNYLARILWLMAGRPRLTD